ncbi:MAG: amino acid permease [Gemmatimonadaceae bacterium]
MTPDLPRPIGLLRATALVVGTIIGASIFVQPSVISGEVPTRGGMLLVWAAAGALTLIGALVTAELASAFPRTGGVYVFLSEAFSPLVGFLWCWAMFWSMHTGIIAALAMVFARYVGYFVPLGDGGLRLVAIAAIVGLSAINYASVRQGSALQTTLTVIKVGAIALVIALGAAYALGALPGVAGEATARTTADIGRGAIPSWGAFVTATVAALFAYGGWHMVTYAAGETVDPTRTIPRALLVGTLVVTACYVGVNAAYVAVLPLQTVVSSTRVAADFADAVLGAGGAALLSALVIVSTLGSMTGIVLAGPRAYLSAAEDGLLPRWIGAVHPRFRTPHLAIAAQAAWASVLVATGTYRALFTRVVYTEWIFFGLMTAGVFLLRRRADYAPRYRAWGYPVLPALFIASTVLIIATQLVRQPAESLSGLLFVLAGVPVYYLTAVARRRRAQPEVASHAGR